MKNAAAHISRLAALCAVAAAALLAACASTTPAAPAAAIRIWTIHYTAHNGADRLATVVLPAWYGPDDNPSIPVVISPHGRSGTGLSNARYFENMPAIGGFALISPDGMGRRLRYFSYGYRGQIDDLAKMPDFAESALSWLHLDRTRVYALGSSMGGQETLLLVARHPELLAGAAAMDSVTDLSRRYAQLRDLPCDAECLKGWGKPRGLVLQSTMRREVGGVPSEAPGAYAARSALAQAAKIAASGVPLQVWWSGRDAIVKDQVHQSAKLVRAVRRINPCAPVVAYAGRWEHSREMRASELLPVALSRFGLLPAGYKHLPRSVHVGDAPGCSL
ncbi:MAG: alpha/beta hydrolase family protein [Gaiellaceae bacterium]